MDIMLSLLFSEIFKLIPKNLYSLWCVAPEVAAQFIEWSATIGQRFP
jgi:hypothetical protein